MRRPLFADVRVRRALAFALDRAGMLAKVRHGLGELSEADESPSIGQAYTADVAKHPYDPARARALFEEAGWLPGPDGVRVKNGQRLSFTIATQSESTGGKQIQALIQRYWRDVGAEALVKNAPTSLFFDNTANGIIQGGKYDVAVFAWAATADPDDSAIYSAENFAPHGQNALFWDDRCATRRDEAPGLATVDWKQLGGGATRSSSGDWPTGRRSSSGSARAEIYNDDLKGSR